MALNKRLAQRVARWKFLSGCAALGIAACLSEPSATGPEITPPVFAITNLGDRIRTIDQANIRDIPAASGALLGVQPLGAMGTVISGPVKDVSGDNLTRWQIDFDSGLDGWGADPYLTRIGTAPIATVTVTPNPVAVWPGSTAQLDAAARDSVGHLVTGQLVSWSSADTLVATVTAAGVITGKAVGSANVSAVVTGRTGVAGVAVIERTTFALGDAVQTAMNANVRSGPSLSAPQVGVQPPGAVGTVVAGPVVDAAGDGLVRWQINFAQDPDGWTAAQYLTRATMVVSSVAMNVPTANVAMGSTVQLSAVGKDAAGNTLADAPMTWTSRDTTVARVSVTGLVTSLALGTAFVAASSGGKSDSAAVTVGPVPVASVSVSPATSSIPLLGIVQLTATPRDSAGNALTGRAVTWSSSNAVVALVSTSGRVTALVIGSATITATSEGKSGTATITVGAPVSVHRGYYAAPNGVSGADGSVSRPWPLATALAGGGGRVQPGDTIWLRGGTYPRNYISTVSGTATAPVVVRQYPGERAIIDGAGTSTSTSTLSVRGAYSVFWGFELTNSNPNRTTTSTSNDGRSPVIANYASHTKYINLVVHDGGVAFYTEPAYVDVEFAGNIIYNNGWQGPDRGHGHGLYLKSLVGPVVARDNVLFNQFGYGVHIYTNAGSGQLNNIRLEGNIAFNNGTLSNNSLSSNVLLGGDDYATGDVIVNNFLYFSPGIAYPNMKVGYGTLRNGTVTVQGNYAVGGSSVIEVGSWSSATVSGNTLVGSGTLVTTNDPQTSTETWLGNTHRRDPASGSWRFRGTGYTFSAWRSATGVAASDVATTGLPGTTTVVVRPNPYEPGRAHVVAYNWGNQASILANLAGVLAVGDQYEVRNVQDLFGPPVASGTFGGGSISIPTAGVASPIPVGWTARSPRTGPSFDTFLVTKR